MNIYFCFPYKKVGGISILFLRLAEELSRKNLANTFLIDYSDGYMAKNYNSEFSTLLKYSDTEDLIIPNDGVIIFQSMTPWSIFPMLKINKDTRALFWSCYPYSLIPLIPGIREFMQKNELISRIMLLTIFSRYSGKVKKFIKILVSRNGLVFQDSVNVDITEKYLGIEIKKPNYLPIPSKKTDLNLFKEESEITENGLRIACLGRVADFKFYTLIRFLEDLDRIAPSFPMPIHVDVIGSGDYLKKLKYEASKLTRYSFSFIDEIPVSKVDEFLIKNTDLLIAMGTTALEGAKLGVPTILLDISLERVPEGYVYSWFYEREHYVLADIFNKNNLVPGNPSLKDRIDELISDYEAISERSIKHFSANHSLDTVTEKFLTYAKNSNLKWSEIENAGLRKKDIFYTIFSRARSIFRDL